MASHHLLQHGIDPDWMSVDAQDAYSQDGVDTQLSATEERALAEYVASITLDAGESLPDSETPPPSVTNVPKVWHGCAIKCNRVEGDLNRMLETFSSSGEIPDDYDTKYYKGHCESFLDHLAEYTAVHSSLRHTKEEVAEFETTKIALESALTNLFEFLKHYKTCRPGSIITLYDNILPTISAQQQSTRMGITIRFGVRYCWTKTPKDLLCKWGQISIAPSGDLYHVFLRQHNEASEAKYKAYFNTHKTAHWTPKPRRQITMSRQSHGIRTAPFIPIDCLTSDGCATTSKADNLCINVKQFADLVKAAQMEIGPLLQDLYSNPDIMGDILLATN